MTASVLQSITNEVRFNNGGSWNGTLPQAFASNQTAGSALLMFYTMSDFAGTHFDTAALDTQLNTYIRYAQQNTNPGGGAATLVALVTQGVAAGANSLNGYLTLNGDVEDWQATYQIEIGGVVPSGVVVGSNGSTQNALAPGTGNLSPGSITLSSAQVPALIIAMAFDTSDSGSHPTPTVNTGTLIASCWSASGSNNAVVSYQYVTTPGTYTPLFNQASSATEDVCSIAIAFLETPTGVPIAWVT